MFGVAAPLCASAMLLVAPYAMHTIEVVTEMFDVDLHPKRCTGWLRTIGIDPMALEVSYPWLRYILN